MPTDKARKDYIRSQQRPGESYTAAMRRLDNTASATPAAWTESGSGLGTTEYDGTLTGETNPKLAGTKVTVSFFGDADGIWPGVWVAHRTADETLDQIAAGRHRFTTTSPTDADIATALAGIGRQIEQVLDGQQVDIYDDSHGDAPRFYEDGGAYYLRYGPGAHDWELVEAEDMGNDDWRMWVQPSSDTADMFAVRLHGTRWFTRDQTSVTNRGVVVPEGTEVQLYNL